MCSQLNVSDGQFNVLEEKFWGLDQNDQTKFLECPQVSSKLGNSLLNSDHGGMTGFSLEERRTDILENNRMLRDKLEGECLGKCELAR